MSDPSARRRQHAARMILAPLVAAAVSAAFPRGPAGLPRQLGVGAVAGEDVIAPMRFVVLRPAAARVREAERLAATVKPLVVAVPHQAEAALLEAGRFFAVLDSALAAGADPVAAAEAGGVTLTAEDAAPLARAADRAELRQAVVRALERSALGYLAPGVARVELGPEVVLVEGGDERVLASDSLRVFADLLAQAVAALPRPAALERAASRLLGAFFRPTVVYEREATERRRDAMRRSADTVETIVQAGQKIIGAHEVVTEATARQLDALRGALVASGAARTNTLLATLGGFGLNFLIVGLFGFILLFYRPEHYRSYAALTVFAGGFALAAVLAGVLARGIPPRIELIPVALPVILFSILFDARIAAVAAMALAMLIGAQPALRGTDAAVFCFVGGVAAALSLGRIRSRTSAYASVLSVAAIYAIAAAVSGAAGNEPVGQIGVSAALGGVNAIGSAALAMILLPLLETYTRTTTDLRLLELADPQRPLLRRLATEAPGTYAHSVAMANLCEAACNAIGANGLLARVGCYYHDVGKLANPSLYVENIGRGRNPHDALSAHQSAAVIRRHVPDGLQLARAAGLPETIRRFIPEHHGTQEISYFLERARADDPGVDPAPFRYPGPRPQSAETAIALLADAVEAALRVLEEPTPETLAEAVDHLVDARIESGQLREAPLTLRQIELIKREFLRVLSGLHHTRVEYPEDAGGITADWEARRD